MDLRIISLLGIVIGIILYSVVFASEYVFFMQTGDKKYNFLRFFPYELNQFKRHNKKTYLFLTIELLAFLCLSCGALFPAIYFAHKFNMVITSYSMFIVSMVSLISFLVLRFVKLTLFKSHLFFTSIFVSFNLLTLMLYYLFFTNPSYQYVTEVPIKIVVIVVILLLVIFELILMFNKTYKNWAKMVKMDAELISRPKYCYLPMLEWGNFLIYILSFIPLIIVMFF